MYTVINSILTFQGAHEKLINALAGANWNKKDVVFSGGWDKQLKKWIIEGNSAKLFGSCETDIVINAITTGEKGEIYVGGSDGHIVRLQVI